MKLETFFEKFDQFADAPDAVAKMRELVLELAVQGRLTSALPSDGTVPSVIEFREDAAALANSLGLRSPKESVEEAEPPFDVPSHWRWMALADIGAAQTGTTPSKAVHDAFNGDIPFIKPADILPNSIDYSNESLTRHGAENGSRLAPSGSLLMVCIGTIGKCNLIERECAFNQQINSLTPAAAVDSRYLLVAARSHSFQDAAWKKSSSTTIAILNKGKWLSIPIPLPPLAEQKRIVAKVDELMALCDRLEAQQQERETRHASLARASLARFADAPTPANLEFLFHKSYTITPADLRKSILTLAVQGKLVPQDPNDKDPETALSELHRARNRLLNVGKLRAAKVPVDAFLEDRLPFIPDSWRTVCFDHLAVAHNNALKAGPFGSALKKEFYVEKGYKIYGQEQVIAGNPFIGDYYIDKKKFAELESCSVSPGDILISLVGTIGKILVLPDGIEPGIINPRVIKLSLDVSLVYPLFIKVLIGSPYAIDFFEVNSHGGTMNILNLSILRALPIPLPPLAEQRRIVAKVDQLMALVDQLETQLTASQATSKRLIEAVVAELGSAA